MKRYMRGIVAAIVSVGFMGGTAGASPDCSAEISYTGAGSTNIVEVCVDDIALTVVCNNNVYVLDTNSQQAVSGAATAQHNTTGGSATSGNVVNTNAGQFTLGAACGQPAAVTTPPPTTTPPPAAEKPSTGMGAVSLPETKATVLPNTASNPVADIAVASTAALAGIMIASRAGITVYRRLVLK